MKLITFIAFANPKTLRTLKKKGHRVYYRETTQSCFIAGNKDTTDDSYFLCKVYSTKNAGRADTPPSVKNVKKDQNNRTGFIQRGKRLPHSAERADGCWWLL